MPEKEKGFGICAVHKLLYMLTIWKLNQLSVQHLKGTTHTLTVGLDSFH